MPPGKAIEHVPVGTVFLGKYRVDAILGSGGMGVVAQCTHLQLNERVAIKMLRKDVLRDLDAVERFTREAQAAAKLKSEYVAHVSDVGRFETGEPYMVMEFLDGLDLDQLVAQRGCLQVPWAVELMLQACEALAEAHSIGIVHRDVKPSNLFVTWRPDGSANIKVLDFGISKSSMGTDMQLTQTQSLLGTPAYMSPEQMRSARAVDGRTDIWSLGTVLYEVLEGRKPFEAESFSEMCVKVAVDPPMAMSNTPLALQTIVMKCLAKTPEQRYATMADLGRDLVPFARDPRDATMLVERMYRMLRRSNAAIEWEGMGTGSGAAVRTVIDGSGGGAPMPAQLQPPAHLQAHGSQPRLEPYVQAQQQRQQQVQQAPQQRDSTPVPAQLYQPPVRAPSTVPGVDMRATQPTRKKKSFLVPMIVAGIAAATIGITIGVVASGASDDGDADVVPHVKAPLATPPAPPAPVPPAPPAPVPPAPVKVAPPPAPPALPTPPVAPPPVKVEAPPAPVKASETTVRVIHHKHPDPPVVKGQDFTPPPPTPIPPKTKNPFDDRTGGR